MDIPHTLKLSKRIARAYENDEFNAAKSFIADQLNYADENKLNWNYDNLIHHSYTYLGLIALKENRLEDAKLYFNRSLDIKGSPQIKTFGPNLSLAEELLKIGEREIVISYLQGCKKVWSFMFSFRKIWRWKNQILQGKIPDFGANLKYHLNLHESDVMLTKYGPIAH